ncbi:hypothetical protein DCAR_0933456 [Daucus carota subsp. sativus]|uniref:Uncharacterized protein n=1 Tax=Daucus carota subsp. sativus TaxID=79200 RepID=A0A175YD04_DAUCS|nr:hypothetical protein DCAR_0933456 [Daucus carota subsp. sativus]
MLKYYWPSDLESIRFPILLCSFCAEHDPYASVLRGTADPDKSILAGEDESIAPTGAEKDDEVMPDGPE